jgi:hypothetical protein
MRRLVETEEKPFDAMIGEKVCLFCGVYIYAGTLSGVGDCLELTDPELVYETGDLSAGPWKNAQPLPSPWRVMRQAIESWGLAKC